MKREPLLRAALAKRRAAVTQEVPMQAPKLCVVADSQVPRRFRLALDMYEFGERMMRSRLRRQHPDASDDQIAQMVGAWREARPGAPDGDAIGQPSGRFG